MKTDTNFNNIYDGCSQGGYLCFYLVFLFPISWKSNKLRRVARSTLTAEPLAFTDGTNSAYFIHQLATKSSLTHSSTQTIRYTDNEFLYNSDNTTTQITDQRLQVENLAIREMNENGKIELNWTVNDKQIADCLTKKEQHAETSCWSFEMASCVIKAQLTYHISSNMCQVSNKRRTSQLQNLISARGTD